jgi:hypothetical protein
VLRGRSLCAERGRPFGGSNCGEFAAAQGSVVPMPLRAGAALSTFGAQKQLPININININ